MSRVDVCTEPVASFYGTLFSGSPRPQNDVHACALLYIVLCACVCPSVCLTACSGYAMRDVVMMLRAFRTHRTRRTMTIEHRMGERGDNTNTHAARPSDDYYEYIYVNGDAGRRRGTDAHNEMRHRRISRRVDL